MDGIFENESEGKVRLVILPFGAFRERRVGHCLRLSDTSGCVGVGEAETMETRFWSKPFWPRKRNTLKR